MFFVIVFSCFGRAARACVLCFCIFGRHNGPVFCVFVFWQTPLKTQGGVNHLLGIRSALARRGGRAPAPGSAISVGG